MTDLLSQNQCCLVCLFIEKQVKFHDQTACTLCQIKYCRKCLQEKHSDPFFPCLPHYLAESSNCQDLCFYCLLPRKLGSIFLHYGDQFGSQDTCPFFNTIGCNIIALYIVHCREDMLVEFPDNEKDPNVSRWHWCFQGGSLGSNSIKLGLEGEMNAVLVARRMVNLKSNLKRNQSNKVI